MQSSEVKEKHIQIQIRMQLPRSRIQAPLLAPHQFSYRLLNGMFQLENLNG